MYSQNDWRYYKSDELYHHGIKGQKWGIRRYQNSDGSLTEEGKKRYSSNKQYFTINRDGFIKPTKIGKEFDKQIQDVTNQFLGGVNTDTRIWSYKNWDEAYQAFYWNRYPKDSKEYKLLKDYRDLTEEIDRDQYERDRDYIKSKFDKMSAEQEAFFNNSFEIAVSKKVWEKADLSGTRKFETAFDRYDPDDPSSTKDDKKIYDDAYRDILQKAEKAVKARDEKIKRDAYQDIQDYKNDGVARMMSKYLDKDGNLKKQYQDKYGDGDNLRFLLEGHYEDDPNSKYNQMLSDYYKKYGYDL